jgi:hypothetical protein
MDGKIVPLVIYENEERIVIGEAIVTEDEQGFKVLAEFSQDSSVAKYVKGNVLGSYSIVSSFASDEFDLTQFRKDSLSDYENMKLVMDTVLPERNHPNYSLKELDDLHWNFGFGTAWMSSKQRARHAKSQIDKQAVYDKLRKRGFITPERKRSTLDRYAR